MASPAISASVAKSPPEAHKRSGRSITGNTGERRSQDRTSSAADPLVALYGFFRERFDADSLERFIKMHLLAPNIAEGIGWNNDHADIAFRVVTVLKRENYIDDDLFQKLRSYFPKLHSQINVLAQACLDQRPSS